MVKRLATSRHDPLGITDSSCKNQLVMVSVQYGPFNPYISIRSTTIGESRVARDPITMHTSWRSNSDIASDIHACKRAVNPRQRSIDSYMHRDLTQSRRLMSPKIAAPPLPTLSRPPTATAPPAVRRAATRRRCSRDCTRSDHVDEEIPFVSNSSAPLVQTDEGVLFPVVDRIRRSTVVYR
ncbi:hypothetical protein F511_21634 [Dorcoceras hygrometricum]|uniref:Uncharacterized protein n=1 Tax=Dorcoceras hygrometricum TaxID=472368 RepID=A0A2Z7A3F8_9LAMI|nr:hypothetical protein F511_21634 [Dorcoceras hygrometricum]